MPNGDMSGKTVLITGGNTGIGKQTAIALAKLGAKVVFTARNLRKGDVARAEIREAANSKQVECMSLDLASFASIERFAKEFLARFPRLDVLILNAGLVLDRRSETEDGFETTFGVNHLGHMYLTSLLRERLKESAPSRIVVVASDYHRAAPDGLDFDDLQARGKFRGWKVYARSKLANIMYARALARRLDPSKVTVNAAHPGMVRSSFGGDGDLGLLQRIGWRALTPFMISPEKGARTSVYLASSPEVEGQSGGYYVRCRLTQPSRAARDDEAAERLWNVSEELIAKVTSDRAA